jgi:hypothetical protein
MVPEMWHKIHMTRNVAQWVIHLTHNLEAVHSHMAPYK